MKLEQIPREAVSLALRGARLPLTAYELVARRGQDPDQWPPALLFGRVESTVRDVVGRITRDDTLVGTARLQRAEVDKRFEAIAKAHAAEATKEAADRDASARIDEIADRRRTVDEHAEARERQAEQARRQETASAARQAAERKDAARQATEARQANLDRSAKQAEAKRLRDEAKALRAKEAAVEAQEDAIILNAAVRAKKSARASR